MEQYILALDQGTTSCRAVLVDKKGDIKSIAQKEFTQYFPKAGWVEHDPLEIWSTQAGVAAEVITKQGLTGTNIASIGITNQRETIVVWNRKTGKPIYNAIVWQDKRTADFCNQLKNEGYQKTIQQKTGLVIDAYFSASKIKWILDNVKGAKAKALNGELACGTIDSWLIWNLSRGDMHITDVTNASRTMLFNIHTLRWDEELLELFDIPRNILPEVKPSSELYGYTHPNLFANKIAISGIAGDQQAALFGQMCTKSGMVKNTYGTGCFMLMNIGNKAIISKNNLLTTIAWQINGQTIYALEGSVFIAGAVVQWLRDGLKIINNAAEIEKLALNVTNSEGVYFVPAFAGLGAPYWNQQAKGTIFGVTRGTNNGHIARAALNAIAYQSMDVLNAMEADANIDITELRVDGGATANNLLMQIQSDVLNATTIRPENIESTVMGAAYFAGLAVGYWKNVDEIKSNWKADKEFNPATDRTQIINDINGWKKAIEAVMFWADNPS